MAHTMVKLTATVCAAALSVPPWGLSAANLGGFCRRSRTTAPLNANQTIELQTRLDGATDAVSRGDVVTMRTQADCCLQGCDKLEGQKRLMPSKM